MTKIEIASIRKNAQNPYAQEGDKEVFSKLLLNFCGHDIYALIGDVSYRFPSGSNEKARIVYKEMIDTEHSWLKSLEAIKIENIPKALPGVTYIVSREVLRVITKWNKEGKKGWSVREDFLAPGEQIRDEKCRVVACKGFLTSFT